MSGKPNSTDIETLRQAASRVRELEEQASRLRALIADSTAKVEAVDFEWRQQSAEVVALLRKMDVAANGNYGWEMRVVWFLSELATSAEHYGRTHQ